MVAEAVGIALCLLGVYLFVRGISGRSSFSIQGPGIKATVNNAAPGIIVCLIGMVIIVFSLQSEVGRVQVSESSNSTDVLDLWLARSQNIAGDEDYSTILATILGETPSERVHVVSRVIRDTSTLGGISKTEYGLEKYWLLLAAVNCDRGYFSLGDASPETMILPNSVLDIWHVSRYRDSSWVRVAYVDRKQAYNHILSLANKGLRFGDDVTFSWLTEFYKEEGLPLALTPADTSGGITNLRELSIKYYGEPQYWRLILWVNSETLEENTSQLTSTNDKGRLWILHFLPPNL